MKKVASLFSVAITAFNLQSCEPIEPCEPPIQAVVDTTITISLSLPAGCNSTAGYSSITGQPCNSSSPGEGTMQVNNTAPTDEIKLLVIDVKATGSNQELKKLPVQLVSTGAPVSDIVKSIKLYRNGNLVDEIDGSNSIRINNGQITTGNGSGLNQCGFIFNDLSYPENQLMANISIATYKIVVDVYKSQGNYPSGSTLTASIRNADIIILSNLKVEDINGDQLPANKRFGSAIGERQTLVVEGVQTVMGTPTIMGHTDANGNIVRVTYVIPLKVTAIDNTYYIGQNALLSTTVSGIKAFAYIFNEASNPSVVDTMSVANSVLESVDAPLIGNGYRIDDGVTRHFILTVELLTPYIINSSYRVMVKQIQTFTDPNLVIGSTITDLLPASSYQTGFQFINN